MALSETFLTQHNPNIVSTSGSSVEQVKLNHNGTWFANGKEVTYLPMYR